MLDTFNGDFTMTIRIKLTGPRPVVKTKNPELYAQHTFHMSMARRYTYNYASLDDYIVENWNCKTMQQIASETNEYYYRVVYRVDKLKALGLLKGKYDMRRSKLQKTRKVLVTWIKEIDKDLENAS
mgnify:CR=1 FL=1